MDDEELAKRLHDLELSKRRLEEEQDRKDEELARNLAKQYSNEDRASMVARSRNQQVLRVGQGVSLPFLYMYYSGRIS